MSYNPWPLGKVPKEFQRPELDQIREMGYEWNDPRDVVDIFEKKVAEFAGSKYAVAVDCCSHGLFLCLKYLNKLGIIITIPKNTYVSVPMQIVNAGYSYRFQDIKWSGVYNLFPTTIYDGAVRWKRGMYVGGDKSFQVVSFQFKKRIPIGRGGMILTNNKDAYEQLKLMSYDGRDLNLPYDDPKHIKTMGYHYYLTPEDAARGIILMDQIPDDNPDSGDHTKYPDLTQYKYFNTKKIM